MAVGLQLRNDAGNIVLDTTDYTATLLGSLTVSGITSVQTVNVTGIPAGSTLWALSLRQDGSPTFSDYECLIDYTSASSFTYQITRGGGQTFIVYGFK